MSKTYRKGLFQSFLNGMAFDLATPHGRMIATVLAGIAEFERELIQERIRSGIAAAKARGKRLGRQPGQRPKSDRLAPKVLVLIGQGRNYRLVGRELGLSKNTVAAIANEAGQQPPLSVDPGHVPATCHEPCYPTRSMAYPLFGNRGMQRGHVSREVWPR